MTLSLKNLKEYSPILARYAVALVFLLIGLDQLLKPDFWVSYFPTNLPFNIAVENAVFYNGIFDLAIGILLFIGLLTRIVSLVAALHLIIVMYYIGYNDISFRDAGIFLASISTLFHGPDKFCLDKKIFKSKLSIAPSQS